MIRFHGYFRSSAAYRCRIAFNLKHVDTELIPVHLRRNGGEQKSAAYAAINPQALVPAIETDAGILTQSLAIIEWLDETYPSPALLPADSYQRALARSVALMVACDIHPLQNLRVLDYLKGPLGHEQADLDAWCRHWIGQGLAACEAVLTRNGGTTPFAFGATPGLADICLVPQLFSADRFGVSLDAMPRLRAIRAACEALPAFAMAHPSRQEDAEA